MRFHSLPFLLVAIFTTWADAQFKYPPPLTRPLSDYTSGLTKSELNFSAGDNLFGGWTTPGRLVSFMLYRCSGNSTLPFSKVLEPLNSSFISDEGSLQPDGTWAHMPLFDPDHENSMNSGSNPIWFHGEFIAPNATTGDLCWFELYPGKEDPKWDYKTPRKVTVNGASDWYFATVPFTVRQARPDGLLVTWKSDGTERGKPTRNVLGKNTTSSSDADAVSISAHFSSGPRAGGSESSSYHGFSATSTFVQGLFVVPWLALGVVFVL